MLTYPNQAKQIMFGTVREAWNLGRCGGRCHDLLGCDDASREIVEIAEAFQEAHQLGMATVLWCYIRK